MAGARVPDGFLNLHKPGGVTSRDVVNRVQRLGRRLKAGHAGTLDPLASGVLVVAVGAATRLIEYVQRQPKTYRTVVRFGARSDTLDADGTIVEAEAPAIPTESAVRDAIASQVGTILQVPPQFSALKVGGRRAYDLARAGRSVELEARPVRIDRIDLLAYAWPRLELEVACGGGTYIRSIARDLGEALGCGGLVEVLVRTAIGPFRLEAATDPEGLTPADLVDHLRPSADALAGLLPSLAISAEAVGRVVRGQALDACAAGGAVEAGEVALIGPDGALVAIGEGDPAAGRIAPRRVLIGPG